MLGQWRFTHNSWIAIAVAYALVFAVAPSIGLATVAVLFLVAGSATYAASAAGNSDGCLLETLEEI